MVKRLIKVGLTLLLSVSFCVPVFASGYSFEHDGSASGESFNGNNKIQTDGIHVGTDPVTGLPVFETVMINQDNNYSGTNTIHVEDTLGNGYDYSSTYNGTLDVTSNDTYQGALKTVISDANVNAVTSVSASDILDNEYNAGVTFSNSTFTKDVTVTNSNVAVSSESNVILGSIPQMDTLNNTVSNIYTYLANSLNNGIKVISNAIVIIRDNLCELRVSNSEQNISLSSYDGSASYYLRSMNMYSYSLDSDYNLSSNSIIRYCNFRGFLWLKMNELREMSVNQYLMSKYNFDRIYSYMIGNSENGYFTFTNNGEYYTLTTYTKVGSWRSLILNRLDTIIRILDFHFKKFYEWYYPLDGSSPFYWRTYDSDTDQEESVNLARVLYDISWYLGHITIGDDIKTEVKSLSDNLTSYQSAEQGIQNRISSSIQSFVPDITLLSGFVAISWVSNYLQQVYIALGSYGTVIMIGLLLGVCMQFIGYFRYKY